ncbi:MAG: hypothetical protein E7352_06275 [Clostridiales bacterium]|nr:hypothetical protein [Clostridiales bacterium]
MDKNVQKEEGISLMDVVRLLLSKIKLLILLVLIGGFIGGAFSVWQTKDVKYYGSQIRFYVNPENPTMSADGSGLNTSGSEYGVYGAYGEHIFDNMIKLLNEDIFAEEMLLRSQDTSKFVDDPSTADIDESKEKEIYKYLPMKDVWTNKNETALAEKLNAAIDDAIPSAKNIIETEAALVDAQQKYISAFAEHSKKAAALEKAWTQVFGTSYNDTKYNDLKDSDKETDEFKNIVKPAYDEERTAYREVTKAFSELDIQNINLSTAKRNLEEKRQAVSTLWEKTAKYQKDLKRFSSAVHFAFLLSNEDIKDANKFARSFIYANISVYGDSNRDFAEKLYAIVIDAVPDFVEAKMAVPSGYTGTDCQRSSRNDTIAQTNSGYTKSQAIKSAILMALAFGVVASVAIIIIDRSDKRLRDYDVITRDFHVPILGVVPTIEMNENNTTKKSNAPKQNKEEK